MSSHIPLVAHIVYRFDIGGLENGVVNLINHMPSGAYRHAVISLTGITDFKNRIRRDDVLYVALNKSPGHLIGLYPRLFRLFRKLRPAIVHTRNLAALEATVPAWAAGVRVRIHGEHGREGADLDPSSVKYRFIRRFYQPFVTDYIALSQDLEAYLTGHVGISPEKITQIYNGVDVERFYPAESPTPITGCPFRCPDHWLVGTVGRMQPVKYQTLLAQAFIQAIAIEPALKARMRLVMIGDGPLLGEVKRLLEAAGLADLAWLPGERNDIPDILRGLNCFVLPSQSEGISNTILEAMASGLPVVATAVGGNSELIMDGKTGRLVPPADFRAMADAIVCYAADTRLAETHGLAGLIEIRRRFSIEAMAAAYRLVYDKALNRGAN
jgi:sugar transferase (PEP-CTERM/EpsH1 system associated)